MRNVVALLLRHALDLLDDEASSASEKAVAVAALEAAHRAGIPLPCQAPEALWKALWAAPEEASAADIANLLGELARPELALRIVSEVEANPVRLPARVLAYLLAGECIAPHVPERLLAAWVDGAGNPQRCRASVLVLTAVSRTRDGLRDLLLATASRWASSPYSRVRMGALELIEEVGWSDDDVEALLHRLLVDDPDRSVRRQAVSVTRELLSRAHGRQLLQNALESEVHQGVVEEIRCALAELAR